MHGCQGVLAARLNEDNLIEEPQSRMKKSLYESGVIWEKVTAFMRDDLRLIYEFSQLMLSTVTPCHAATPVRPGENNIHIQKRGRTRKY